MYHCAGARLGNKLVLYAFLLSLKVLFKLRAFTTKAILNEIGTYFDADSFEVKPAEDFLCDFSENFHDFNSNLSDIRERQVLELLRNLTNNPNYNFIDQNGKKELLVPYEHKQAHLSLLNSR